MKRLERLEKLERLGGIVTLGDVCEKGSSNIAQKDLQDCEGEYPIYGASGLISHVNFYKQSEPYIAVVKDGAGIGRVMLLPAKSSVIGTMQYIFPIDREVIDLKYLYHAMCYMNLAKYFSGATIPHIYFKDYKKEEIILPSLEEQKKVAGVLDAATALAAKRRRQLALLDTLTQSRFVEMFGDLKNNTKGWQQVKFTECAQIDTNMVHDFTHYQNYPHIGIDSIEKDSGQLYGYRTVAEDGVISGKYLFSEEHIIYSKIRPNLNKVALPNFVGVCSADAYPILVKKDVCIKEYLAYVMRSRYFLDYILVFSNRTNLPKVNKQQVEGFELPLPPVQLQKEFADFVSEVDRQKAALRRSLTALTTLKSALMQEYFGN